MLTQYEKHLKGRHTFNLNKSKLLRDTYSLNPKRCKNCSETIKFESKKNTFCCHACSASYTNIKRAERGFTVKGRFKTKICSKCNVVFKIPVGSSKSICNTCFIPTQTTYSYNLKCNICNIIFKSEHKRKTCGKECLVLSLTKSGSKGGKKSVLTQQRRSKNEIYFYELCKDRFVNVAHNVPMFNGWDADIVLLEHKIAILWNGIWHYKKITKKHSVEQVQNRDKIKCTEITKAGYIPYIIKDNGIKNKRFVEEQFQLFLQTFTLDKQ